MAVKKAIVLAAGFGTRLRPLTCSTPKPLLPVWGESMLSRIVSRLREGGVTDIVVNCHYLSEQVKAWCVANGCRAAYEPEILGTGGVLNPLREWLGGEAFYLVNGDIVVEGLERLPELKAEADELGAALVTEAGPRTIEVEPTSGYVTNWRSEDAGQAGTFTYCGFALLKPAVLDYVAPTGFSSIVEAYERAAADGKFIRAVNPEGLLWTDAGTLKDYLELNADGEDNAYAALPQLLAAGFTAPELMGARGSDRVFFREGDRVAVVFDDAKRRENARYAGHARFLKAAGIPVPEVLSEHPAAKTLVMEWAGGEKRMELEDYVRVVELLAQFAAVQVPPELELEPAFGPELWRWEQELFVEHCLGHRHFLGLPDAVAQELAAAAARLDAAPQVLVHRDFQSTNLLWKRGEVRIIDFQGMRLGPAAYDLASLVYDPYVKFTAGERRALVQLYAKKSGRPEIVEEVPLAAVRRLVQCLGAYGRLASVGQGQFLKFIAPALDNLLVAADAANLDATGALAEELIAREAKIEGRQRAAAGECQCGHGHEHADGGCQCGHGHEHAGGGCQCGHAHGAAGGCSCGKGHSSEA